jgi:endonuclease III
VVRACISPPNNFDLDLSMYPSFLSSYYDRVGEQRWQRFIPPKATLYMENGGKLCCEGDGCSYELLEKVSGLWCWDKCFKGLEKASSPLGLRVRELLEIYEGLVVSAAPWEDRLLIAAAVVLSRRTSYAWNVRRWMRILFSEGASVEAVAKKALKLPNPQPRLLAKIIHELASLLDNVKCGDTLSIRRSLLSVSGIGPKTADAIILFTGCDSKVAPADVHLQRFLEGLGVKARQPQKTICLRYGASCQTCPISNECASGIIVNMFEGAAGLVQTLAYVYDTLGVNGWRTRLKRLLARFYTSSGGTSPGR